MVWQQLSLQLYYFTRYIILIHVKMGWPPSHLMTAILDLFYLSKDGRQLHIHLNIIIGVEYLIYLPIILDFEAE